ncbi:MAG: TRAP transporter small permease subunit [Elusimicrobia bacterium]|nr:TRAP transporter small permease subunit [Elusimicrobiota bacterium]
MKLIFKFENCLVRAEKGLIVSFIFLLVALSFLQVLLRLLFHSGIVWLDPLLRHLVLWAGLLGAAVASRYAKHFALDALVKFLPGRFHRPLNLSTGIFAVLVSGTLFYAAAKFIKDEFSSSSIAFYAGDFGVKGGWAGMVIPAAFILIAFHTLLNIFRREDKGQGRRAG